MSVNFVHSLVIFVLKYFNTKVTKINTSQMAFESIVRAARVIEWKNRFVTVASLIYHTTYFGVSPKCSTHANPL